MPPRGEHVYPRMPGSTRCRMFSCTSVLDATLAAPLLGKRLRSSSKQDEPHCPFSSPHPHVAFVPPRRHPAPCWVPPSQHLAELCTALEAERPMLDARLAALRVSAAAALKAAENPAALAAVRPNSCQKGILFWLTLAPFLNARGATMPCLFVGGAPVLE